MLTQTETRLIESMKGRIRRIIREQLSAELVTMIDETVALQRQLELRTRQAWGTHPAAPQHQAAKHDSCT